MLGLSQSIVTRDQMEYRGMNAKMLVASGLRGNNVVLRYLGCYMHFAEGLTSGCRIEGEI